MNEVTQKKKDLFTFSNKRIRWALYSLICSCDVWQSL